MLVGGYYRNSSLAIEYPVDARSHVIGYDLVQQSVKFDITTSFQFWTMHLKKKYIWVLKMHACELTVTGDSVLWRLTLVSSFPSKYNNISIRIPNSQFTVVDL